MVVQSHTPKEATITVRAFDSLVTYTDYSCDGTDDQAEINAALQALPAIGGRVLLMEGTYNISGVLVMSDKAILEGSGHSTVINASGASIANAIEVNGQDTGLKNFKAVLVAGCGSSGSRPNIIYCSNKNNPCLENLWLVGDKTVADDGSNERQNGIYFNKVRGSRVFACRIENNRRNGISILNNSRRNTFTGNISESNGFDGIYLESSDHNSFTGGAYNANTLFGIEMTGSHYNTITGNTCSENGHSGMYLGDSTRNMVGSNTLSENGYAGVYAYYADRNTFVGNACDENEPAPGVDGCGIYLRNCDYCIASSNQCSENRLHGLRIRRCDYTAILGNVCRENVIGDGIKIEADGSQTCNYNSVTGNACRQNGSNGIDVGDANANKNVVVGNILLDNPGGNLSDTGTETEVAHNIVA